jgi:hypothetical protein
MCEDHRNFLHETKLHLFCMSENIESWASRRLDLAENFPQIKGARAELAWQPSLWRSPRHDAGVGRPCVSVVNWEAEVQSRLMWQQQLDVIGYTMHFSSTPMYKTVVEITHTSNLSLRSVPSRLNHQFLLQINFRTDKRPPTTFPERSKIHCNGHTSVSIVQRSKCCRIAYLQTPSIFAAPTKNNSLKISSVKKTIALPAEAPRRRRFPETQEHTAREQFR